MSNDKVVPLPLAAPALDRKPKKKGGSDRMRLFLAVYPPPEVRAAAHALLEPLPPDLPLRRTPEDNIHLTLVFLGDVEWGRTNPISRGLGALLGGLQPFELQVAGLGAFPNANRPRVLWQGLQESEPLTRLQDAVATLCETLGFRRETKPWHPHLTLGRMRRLPEPGALAALRRHLGEATPAPLSWPVNRVILFRSFLENRGARYVSLAEIPLG
jgi:2'-5' RNA ligase